MRSSPRVVRRRPEAGFRSVSPGAPEEIFDAERPEQCFAGEVAQRPARAAGDESADQRHCATRVDPALARRFDDRAVEDEAVAVGRHFHGDLRVERIGIGAVLVPFEAHRHVEGVPHGDPAAFGIGGEVGIFGEAVDHGAVERRHEAALERDAVEQARDALGHRAQVVQGIGAEGDLAEIVAPGFVAPLEITLEHQLAVAADREPVEIAQQAGFETGIEPALQTGGKTRGFGRLLLPTHRHFISPKLDRAAAPRNLAPVPPDSSAK